MGLHGFTPPVLRVVEVNHLALVYGGTSTRGPCVRGGFEHVQPPPCSKSILHISSVHAQTIITFVFQEHTLTRASMPKPQ